jgi:ABC-type glycerol-3-phosphate transport system substrate-binding protein
MKSFFKLPLLAVAVTLFVTACSGNNSPTAADSVKVDTATPSKSTNDTAVIKIDTNAANIKIDTLSKMIAKTTSDKKANGTND